MRLALFQPDQPGNVGTMLRLAACLGTPVDIIEPCGFPLDDRQLKRAALDYADWANMTRHRDWGAFIARLPGRLVLLTTHGDTLHHDAVYHPDDTLLLGRESAGAPDFIHAAATLRVRIAQVRPTRSLNVAVAAGIVLAEALRQTGGFPIEL
jgi:tRNA (cytidine/uridine-2'-O-)-methyltransferase